MIGLLKKEATIALWMVASTCKIVFNTCGFDLPFLLTYVNMRISLLLFSLCLLAACGTQTWYVTPSGLHYRVVYSNNHDSTTRAGGIAKFRYIQLFHDSIRQSTGGQMPIYQLMIPGLVQPYGPMEPLAYGIRQGDSIEIAQRLDSLVNKKMLASLPPGARGVMPNDLKNKIQ